MKISIAGLLLLAACCSAGAHADDRGKFQLGLQYVQANYGENDLPDLEPAIGVLVLAQPPGNAFRLEARVGIGITADERRLPPSSSTRIEAEVDNLLGGYLMIRLAALRSASFYAVTGLTRVEVTTTGTVGSFSSSRTSDETGFSFGFGLDYAIAEKLRIDVEYMSYLNGDRFDLGGVGLGLRF